MWDAAESHARTSTLFPFARGYPEGSFTVTHTRIFEALSLAGCFDASSAVRVNSSIKPPGIRLCCSNACFSAATAVRLGAGGAGIFRSSCTISTLLLQVIWHFDHGDRTHGAAPLSVGKLLRAFAGRVRDGVHRKGVVSREDFERLAEGSFPLPLPSAEGRHNAAVRESFKIGDKVRIMNEFVSGHVRMPGYIRRKIGIVVTASRPYPFPDAAAHNLRTQDEPAYDVRFRTDDLWPQAADEATVHVAVFQSYLEKAPRPASRKGLP